MNWIGILIEKEGYLLMYPTPQNETLTSLKLVLTTDLISGLEPRSRFKEDFETREPEVEKWRLISSSYSYLHRSINSFLYDEDWR